MSTTHWTKDPDATLDYVVDWTTWLETDDAIVTSTWTAETGITIDSTAITGARALVWLSGGTVDTTYRVTNRVTTAAGRIDDRTFRVTIYQR